jgi:hypothetical protein
MASTYTANQGIEKMDTGDQSGTWGGTVNTNMDIIDRAISGVGALTLTGSTTTLTTTDGTLTDGMYRVLVLGDGGDLGSDNTITLSPNDQDKAYLVYNNLSANRNAIFTQGTGANATVENGETAWIYADGGGSGAIVRTAVSSTKLLDQDGDTGIRVEEGGDDDDTIRFDVAGAEDFTMSAGSLNVLTGSVLALPDAAVATPALTNTGDLNTGLYFPAADTVGVTTGGTEQFRFGSNTTAAASKNVIINGSMQVCQRPTSTAGVGNGDTGYVGPDQWYFDEAGTVEGVITVSQETGGGVGGQDRWMKILCTTEEALGATTDQMQMMQRLEAQNCVPLKNGATGIAETTISADIIIHADGSSGLSFPVKVAFSVHTQDGTARQCIGDMSIAANDTWERVSITLPADSTATFVSDNALGCTFNISLCAGSGRNATNLTWANEAADFNTSSSDNILDQANNYLGVTRVMWEVGAVPTDFPYENITNILQKCQRYFYSTNLYEQSTRWGLGAYDATNALGTRQTFPVQMRAAPTAAFTSSVFLSAHNGSYHDTSITLSFVEDQFGYQPYISVQSSGTQGEWYWIGDNSGDASTGAVTFTAEL